MSDKLLCDRCDTPIANPDTPSMIGDIPFCKDCHDKICGNCTRIISDPDNQYNISAVGPGTTCPICTARYVSWLCQGCGTEIHERTNQMRVDLSTKYDGTYCENCVDDTFQQAKKVQEEMPSNREAPF